MGRTGIGGKHAEQWSSRTRTEKPCSRVYHVIQKLIRQSVIYNFRSELSPLISTNLPYWSVHEQITFHNNMFTIYAFADLWDIALLSRWMYMWGANSEYTVIYTFLSNLGIWICLVKGQSISPAAWILVLCAPERLPSQNFIKYISFLASSLCSKV